MRVFEATKKFSSTVSSTCIDTHRPNSLLSTINYQLISETLKRKLSLYFCGLKLDLNFSNLFLVDFVFRSMFLFIMLERYGFDPFFKEKKKRFYLK